MRIVHLLSQTQLTGAEVYAITLADWQIDHGHQVVLISNELHLPTKAAFIARVIHTKSFWVRLKNIFFLRSYIRAHHVQIIHAHSRAAVRVGFWSTLGLPCALVSTVHGRQHYSFSKRLFDFYGSKVIAICENVAQHLVHDFKMNSRKIVTIGNPISIQSLPLQKNLKKQNRVALIGRTTGPKGEKTAELLENTFPDLLEQKIINELDLIGGNIQNLPVKGRQAFERLQKLYPEQVRALAHVDQLDEKYQNYDLIIGAGRVAMSALISGIPSIALGEYTYEGLIELENFQQALKTNFGDIGPSTHSQKLDTSQIKQDLIQALKNPAPIEQREILRNMTLDVFSENDVCAKILEIYKSALFLQYHPQNIPILMYHKITDEGIETPHRIFVTKADFENHLKFFQDQGFTTLFFQDLLDFKDGKKEWQDFPRKPLILTFDDGYQNNLTNALPLLKKYQMKAVVYLLAENNLKSNSWDAGQAPQLPLMTKPERFELAKSGFFEIGSHGFCHKKITDMTDSEALYELQESKRCLEQELGCPVQTFAFTYGSTNPHAAKLAQKAGYRYAINTDTGGLHLEENPFSVFRVSIFPEDQVAQIRKKTSSWYRCYYFWKRGK